MPHSTESTDDASEDRHVDEASVHRRVEDSSEDRHVDDASVLRRVEDAKRGSGVAVLIPCYDEALTIGKVVDDFRSALPLADVYVYDNNSTDGSAEIARAHGAIVRTEPLQGKGNVVRQMFRDVQADYYLMVDGDDTYPAEAAPELIAPLARGVADMSVGDRLSNGTYGKENDRALHGFGNDLIRWLIKVIYGYSFADVMTGYRAFARPFVKTMPVLSEGFQVETEISIHAVDRKWRIADVPVDYRKRPEGSVSKLSTFSDGAAVLLAITTLFRSYRPMAFFGWLALVLVALGLVVGVPVVVEFMYTHAVDRFPSALLAVALVLCGALSMTVGLVLDTVAKSYRKQWEIDVYREYERWTSVGATSTHRP